MNYLQNPFISTTLQMKGFPFLPQEVPKRPTQLNPIPMQNTFYSIPSSNLISQLIASKQNGLKKPKLEDSQINMLSTLLLTQNLAKSNQFPKPQDSNIIKPTVILTNSQNRGDNFITDSLKAKSQDFLNALKPRLVEEIKADTDSTEAKSESSSKSSVNKKRRLRELNEEMEKSKEQVVDPVKLGEEKLSKEKEIDELIKSYNNLIAEKKRISKEKRQLAKKKNGRLRKLADEDNELEEEINDEIKLVSPTSVHESAENNVNI